MPRGIMPPRPSAPYQHRVGVPTNLSMTSRSLSPSRGVPRRADFASSTAALRTSAALLLALSLGSHPAAAQTAPPAPRPAAKPAAKPPSKPAAKVEPKPIEPVLTRDELRACMSRQDKVREQNAEAGRLQAELEREKTELLKDGEVLKADLANLDRTDADVVEAYNKRAIARDERIAAFEPRLNAFNAKVESLNAERAAYTSDCINRKYDEKDEKALKKQP